MTDIPSNGVRVPRWLVVAIALCVAILGAGFEVGLVVAKSMKQIDDNRTAIVLHTEQIAVMQLAIAEAVAQTRITNFRLCRIEKSNHVDLWETCIR